MRILAAAASDGFYLTTTAGTSWRRLPVPQNGGTPVSISFDPSNPNVLFAITTLGVFRSIDFGEEFLGESWESLTQGLPQRPSTFVVGHGSPSRVYALIDDALFTRELKTKNWTRATNRGIGEYAETYPWLLVDPGNPDRLISGFKSTHEGLGTLSVIQETTDAAQSWTHDFQSILQTVQTKGMAGVLALGVQGQINHAIMDPADSKILYAAGARGVMKSNDSGRTWSLHRKGLRIPRIERVFKPRHSQCVFAATPGGLYLSKDAGATWQDANLWLQFDYNTRRELGGAAFIDAYWRGRYYGFIEHDM